MTSKSTVDEILDVSHGEIDIKLEAITTKPARNATSALKYIKSHRTGLGNTFITSKGLIVQDVNAVNLATATVNYDSMLGWLRSEGIEQLAAGFKLYDKVESADPRKAELLALLTSAATSPGIITSLNTLMENIIGETTTPTPGVTSTVPVTAPTAPSGEDLTSVGLTDAELANLTKILDDINGQDAYNVEYAAIRTLKQTEYLVVPKVVADRSKSIPLDKVGTRINPLSHLEKLQTLALNARKLGMGDKSWTIAIVRVFLIEYGYLRLDSSGKQAHVTHNEVIVTNVPATVDDVKLAANWLISTKGKEFLDYAKVFGLLAPVMASDVFLRTGHHYITGSVYDDNYNRLFDASTLSHLKGTMAYEDLFHTTIHWIGPYTMRLAWTNLMTTPNLPSTFKTRYNAAPAGCAIITTTKAVIDAISSLGCYKDVRDMYAETIDSITIMEPLIKREATKYFDLNYLFGHVPLTDVEKRNLELTKSNAQRLAPICKAFLLTVGKDTALSRARVLDKYAEANQGVRFIAERWFKNYMSSAGTAKSLKEALGGK